MGNNRFMYDTITRSGVISPLYSSDYHPSYPAENLRSLWTDYTYRTKYGSGSGWGYWSIEAATNNSIDFNDGSLCVAYLTAGDYDADSLAAHIAARMTAVGGQTYTCTYSNTTNRFTISASSTFSILWSSGSHHSTTVGEHIGFDVSQDDTGTNTYMSDYIRSHNYGGFEIDSWDGSSVETYGCFLIGMNLTSGYQILKLQRWYGGAWEDIGDFTAGTYGRAYIFYSAKSATKYRVVARDWTNPDKYLEFGVVILGNYVDLSRGYEYGATLTHDDTSERAYSKHGYLNIIMGFEQVVQAVQYELMSADVAKLDTLWDNVMKRYPFVFMGNSDSPCSDMTYAILRSPIEKVVLDDYFKKVTMVWEKVL